MGSRMIAKDTYFVDEKGKITTDANKSVRRIARKGSFIRPDVVKTYGFKDGAPVTKKAEPKSKASDAKAAEPKAAKSK